MIMVDLSANFEIQLKDFLINLIKFDKKCDENVLFGYLNKALDSFVQNEIFVSEDLKSE